MTWMLQNNKANAISDICLICNNVSFKFKPLQPNAS